MDFKEQMVIVFKPTLSIKETCDNGTIVVSGNKSSKDCLSRVLEGQDWVTSIGIRDAERHLTINHSISDEDGGLDMAVRAVKSLAADVVASILAQDIQNGVIYGIDKGWEESNRKYLETMNK